MARLAECARQTVTRLESGDSLPRIHLFLAILGIINATDEERAEARQLWDIADADTASIEYSEDLPATYRRFRLDEAEAIRERSLDLVIVPGLLQTPDYAAGVWRGRHLLNRMPEWESRAATERRSRQELLRRKKNPLQLHALLDQAVLGRMIGSQAIMVAQLDNLLEIAALPNVTIQILSRTHGAHGAMSGPLLILDFDDDDEPNGAYVESVLGLATVDKRCVSALSAVWDEAAAGALSSGESEWMIKEARDEVMKSWSTA